MVGVLVGNEDGVEAVDIAADGGEAGEGFALSKAGVNEDAGTLGFEQGEIARTAGGEDGDTQADERFSRRNFGNNGRAKEWRQRRSGGKRKVKGPKVTLLAGQAGTVELEAVGGAEDSDGDFVGLKELVGEGLELVAGDCVNGREDFVE